MSLLRKREKNSSRRVESSIDRAVPTYTYHNFRNEREDLSSRDMSQVDSGIDNVNRSQIIILLEKFGLLVIAGIIITLFASIVYLSNSSNVKIIGNSNNSLAVSFKKQLQINADKLLSSSIMNSNKITINSNKIASQLEAEFPVYRSITVSLPLFGNQPIIYLTPSTPSLIVTTTNNQYLVNEDGKVMVSGNAINIKFFTLPHVNFSGVMQVKNGQQIMTPTEVQFIQTINFEISNRGDKISSINMPQGTSELDVYLSGEPYYVKFNLENNDPRQQAGTFLATQHYLKGKGIVPKQYIDVRIDGRVYYK
jgi:hypothetical protein